MAQNTSPNSREPTPMSTNYAAFRSYISGEPEQSSSTNSTAHHTHKSQPSIVCADGLLYPESSKRSSQQEPARKHMPSHQRKSSKDVAGRHAVGQGNASTDSEARKLAELKEFAKSKMYAYQPGDGSLPASGTWFGVRG